MIHKKEKTVNGKNGVIFHKNATQSLPYAKIFSGKKMF